MKLCIWKDILLFYEGRNVNIGVKRRISFSKKLMEKGDPNSVGGTNRPYGFKGGQ